jgi:hypothetical protein
MSASTGPLAVRVINFDQIALPVLAGGQNASRAAPRHHF